MSDTLARMNHLREGRTAQLMVVLLLACSPGKETGEGPASESDGETTVGTGATDTGGPGSYGDCDDYLECVGAVAPDMLPAADMAYGPESVCWDTNAQVMEGCLAACTAGLAAFGVAYPDEPKCGGGSGGGTTSEPEPTTGGPEPTTGGPEPTTGGPAAAGISGFFLLAVATTVDPGKPFQFLARNEVTEVDGAQKVSICLQPLSLSQGSVLKPREPIGEPLCFPEIQLDDDSFMLQTGVMHIAGGANPITGADVVMSLIILAGIESDDFYCGNVAGEVMDPPVGSIVGSTFAAVRLDDVKVLPDPVLIDCFGTSVTDQ